MRLSTNIQINAPKEKVWSVISNIEESPKNISGILDIEILEQPENGIVGLKWRESRIMFGKTATEVMWITEANENEFYTTRAESHGSIYNTNIRVKEQDGHSELSMTFGAEPQSFGAKVMSFVFKPLLVKSLRKALEIDLKDIKKAAEA